MGEKLDVGNGVMSVDEAIRDEIAAVVLHRNSAQAKRDELLELSLSIYCARIANGWFGKSQRLEMISESIQEAHSLIDSVDAVMAVPDLRPKPEPLTPSTEPAPDTLAAG